MSILRVVIIESELDGMLVGHGLEKDLAVQGKSIEEVIFLITRQLDFYTGKLQFDEVDFDTNIDDIFMAPEEFFQRWDNKDCIGTLEIEY